MTAETQGFTDIRSGDWIDRYAPQPLRPYLRLARLDRPIGTWLLLFPCWWSLALALPGWPGRAFLEDALLFALGAVVMRGAGCTINDIMDRELDAQVERTRSRPLPSGQVSVVQAFLFLGLQLGLGLLVLARFPFFALVLGAASLVLVFTYPLMKRITWWPQAFLGLTFNWGALMGWAVVHEALGTPALWLYAAGVAWTLGYDTIYAHQDKADDARVGIKSTALRLGDGSRVWVAGFYIVAMALLAVAVASAGLGWAVWPGLGLAAVQLAWQVRDWSLDDPADCLRRFRSNRWFGWLVLGALVAGQGVGR